MLKDFIFAYKNHIKWLNSLGLQGKRLSIEYESFQKYLIKDKDLKKSYFYNVNFQLSEISNSDFTESFLRSSDFRFSEFMNVNLNSSNLQDSYFDNSKLLEIDFSGANLNNTSFIYTCISNSNFSNTQMVNVDLRFLNPIIEKPKLIFINSTIHNSHLNEANISYSTIQNSTIESTNFFNSRMDESELINIMVENSDMTSTKFQKAKIDDCKFSKTNLSQSNFSNCNLINCNFLETDLSYSIFDNAELKNIYFNNIDLSEVKIKNSTLININFINCFFLNTVFENILIDEKSFLSLPNEIIEIYKNELNIVNVEFEEKKGSFVIREIEFPTEYKLAGLSILNYFGTVLKDNYPDSDVAVTIKQEGLKVSMIIESNEGNIEEIEKKLDDYFDVVTGEKPISSFSEDRLAILELKNQLRLMALQIEFKNEMIGFFKSENELKKIEISHLIDIIRNPKQVVHKKYLITGNLATDKGVVFDGDVKKSDIIIK